MAEGARDVAKVCPPLLLVLAMMALSEGFQVAPLSREAAILMLLELLSSVPRR